jgi:hypothetical protein
LLQTPGEPSQRLLASSLYSARNNDELPQHLPRGRQVEGCALPVLDLETTVYLLCVCYY